MDRLDILSSPPKRGGIMRADRLLALLMLLQSRGRMTARELANELEVSERTIYRDADALSAAGVPVYADRGPVGGFALVDSYRTDLTGMTEEERRALLLLSIPGPLADLGLREPLAAALRKLAAALPGTQRDEEQRVRQRFYFDPRPWAEVAPVTPSLADLQKAAWEDRRAEVAYRLPSGPMVEQRIDVYGLVAKEGAWHVLHLCDERVLALPVSELLSVRLLDEHFTRRAGFDLQKGWAAWCEGLANRPRYEMVLRIPTWLVDRLGQYGLAGSACEEMPGDAEGRVVVEATCESFDAARARILALGGAVEVVSPEPLRRSVIDHAEQICARYRHRS
jgi:predicted DNA-binding transcriptional regulator YafY